jgi:hypothetical protein
MLGKIALLALVAGVALAQNCTTAAWPATGPFAWAPGMCTQYYDCESKLCNCLTNMTGHAATNTSHCANTMLASPANCSRYSSCTNEFFMCIEYVAMSTNATVMGNCGDWIKTWAAALVTAASGFSTSAFFTDCQTFGCKIAGYAVQTDLCTTQTTTICNSFQAYATTTSTTKSNVTNTTTTTTTKAPDTTVAPTTAAGGGTTTAAPTTTAKPSSGARAGVIAAILAVAVAAVSL